MTGKNMEIPPHQGSAESKSSEALVVEKLKAKKLTITTAESCTGGLLSGRLINISGVSDCLKEAYVTYCDEAKHKLLGVTWETLEKHTAVSQECAFEMAVGGARAAAADICLAITGVAGPDSGKSPSHVFGGKCGSTEFPVGLVFIGCYYKGNTIVNQYQFEGDRASVREQAVQEALELLLQTMDMESPPHQGSGESEDKA